MKNIRRGPIHRSRSKGATTTPTKPSSSPSSKTTTWDAGDLKVAGRLRVSTNRLGGGACPFRGRAHGVFPLDVRCPLTTLVQPVASAGTKRILDEKGVEVATTGDPDSMVPVLEPGSYCVECLDKRVREKEAKGDE